ncbi:MAG: ornithine carbamoyltransferase [Candidatus Methanospirare jalkutatii]|nr:ornithine carbamoyltransferase [Candidatus Methanospirare jalkutatii]
MQEAELRETKRRKRDFISIFDLSTAELERILSDAAELKRERREGRRIREDLAGKTLTLIFEKPSTRTRISFEVAMRELGGSAISLSWKEMQLGRGERIKETAKVLSSYVDAVCIRAFKHETVEEFAIHATIPTINALTDREHPCQTLADLLTIIERKGRIKGLKIVWVGDATNVCNSLIGGCALLGAEICVACPKGYEPDAEILRKALAICEETGGNVELCVGGSGSELRNAVKDADVLCTDVWVSMGEESEAEKRRRDLHAYRIDSEILGLAADDAIVLHCMPVHIGEELTEDVLYGEHSAVFEQAENRLHTQKALLLKLLSE